MTGPLAVVIVLGAIIALWVGLGVISRTIDGVVEFLGWAVGSAFRPRAPLQPQAEPGNEITLTRPSEEVREQLTATGVLDASNGCVTTSSGVLVQIGIGSGSARLACRWHPAVMDKPTQIMGDVLRAVRQVDAGAHVVL